MAPHKMVAILLATALVMAPAALAQQVGTATAVNPETDSTPPGGSTVALTVGAKVVHKERIHTTPSGSVQLLFLDKSSLSIGPNTSILIDEFVYDPSSGNGHMVVQLTEGAMRYVGGQLSHEGAVTISTADATIGIRGGTATVIQGPNGTEVINHYGTITISNGTGTITITRPGFTVTITGWNVPLGQPAARHCGRDPALPQISVEPIRPERRRRRAEEHSVCRMRHGDHAGLPAAAMDVDEHWSRGA